MPKELIYLFISYFSVYYISAEHHSPPCLFCCWFCHAGDNALQLWTFLTREKRKKVFLIFTAHVVHMCSTTGQNPISSGLGKWDINVLSLNFLRSAMLEAAVKQVGRGEGPVYVINQQIASGPLLYHTAEPDVQ